jgi:CBS domain-containing protein
MMSMAAMMGGTMRSPLTAVAFMLELTGDLAILPALLIACAAAYAVTVLFMRRSILTEKVARRGYHVTREYSVSPLARMRVEDVMERDVPTLAGDTTLGTIARRLAEGDPVLGRRYAWPLVDERGGLTGLVTRGDLMQALTRSDGAALTLQQLGSSRLIIAHPDELLEEAVARMARAGIGRVLVVDRDAPERLLGYLGRTGIADAWRQLVQEEELREAGWITSRFRLLRRNVRRVLGNQERD